MDGKDFESSHFHTIVFMDGEKDDESGSLSKKEFQCIEIQSENIDDLAEHSLKEENISESEELVIDGELEEFQTDNNIKEIKYAEHGSHGDWCNEIPNINSDKEEDDVVPSNVEYYEIPAIDSEYYGIPNHVMKGVSDEDSSNVKCYQMSSIVHSTDGALVGGEDTPNVEYYEIPHIIHDNDNNLMREEAHLQSANSEYYEEPTIIVHLGNNLTIDEKGQIHPSTSEYFPVEEDGNEVERIDPSTTVFYRETTDNMCCDNILMENHCNDGEQFEDESQKEQEIFIVSTIEELQTVLQEYSERTSSQFVGSSKSKNFGSPSSECVLTGHQISWCDIQTKDRGMDTIIKFDGVPYMIVGNNILHCQFGTNKSAADRERRKAKRAERGIDVTDHDVKYPTKKCGCPAKVNIKQIIRFPEFKIEKDTGWKRRDCAARLRQKLKESRETVAMEMKFVGRLPDVSEHRYHESLQDLVYTKELVLQDLVVKAQDLWLEGKSNLEIFELIRRHVIDEMFWKREAPDIKMKKYYPTKKDIRNYITRVYHMCRLRDTQKESIKDIINNILIEECGTNVSFDVREKSLNENNEIDSSDDDTIKSETSEEGKLKKKEVDKKVETFLFCFQTPTQQRLMKKYSNLIYIVEVDTLKPTKRVLTYFMYALLVQTNVDYQVVGLMIISKHRKDGLQEGLNLFREWNTFWNPKYFLVDYCEVIYNTVTTVFPDAFYFLNPHSCEKKWLEFMKTPSNDLLQHTDELIKHLKNMQYSLTEESLSVAALVFEQSQVWQNSEKFRTWFQTKWLPLAKYWVMGYRPEDLLILQHIKSSIDCCINVYSGALYQSAKFDGFIELLKSVTMVFPKAEYDKYVTKSNDAYWFYKQFSSTIDSMDYMQGVPISIIPYVLDVCELAKKHDFVVNCEQIGVFNVEYTSAFCCQGDQNNSSILEHEGDKTILTSDEHSRESKISSQTYDDSLSMYALNDDKGNYYVNNVSNIREVNIKETTFGWIECSKAMEPGEYTVSFGDVYSYPFCTCSHWMLYRLPCVHMFVVFMKIPGWRYDMLSPVYRCSSVLHIDCSCISNSPFPKGIDVACQSDEYNVSVGTQTQTPDSNIFESTSNFKISDLVLGQAKEFLLNINKNSFLFRNKMLHTQLRCQLDKLVGKLSDSLKNKSYQFSLDEGELKKNTLVDNRKPLKISTLNLQQIKKLSDSTMLFQCDRKSQPLPKLVESIHSNTSIMGNFDFIPNKVINKKTSLKTAENITNRFLVKTFKNTSNTLLSNKNDEIINDPSSATSNTLLSNKNDEIINDPSSATSKVVFNKSTDVNFSMPTSINLNPVNMVISPSLDPVNVSTSIITKTSQLGNLPLQNTTLHMKRSNVSNLTTENIIKRTKDSPTKNQINKVISIANSSSSSSQNKGKYTLRRRVSKDGDRCDANSSDIMQDDEEVELLVLN